MCRRRGVRALLTMVAVVCALSLTAFADSQARIVRLSAVEGGVQVDRHLGQGFEKALMNLPITEGMRLKTAADGRAEVEFEDGSTLRLAPDTLVDFPVLSLRSSGDKASDVQVERGTAYFKVNHKGHDQFRVRVGGEEIALGRSAHFRVNVDRGEARVAVFKGEVELQGEHGVKVKKNETVAVDLSSARPFEVAKGIDKEPYDGWDESRESYHDRYASNQGYVRSPYSYGFSDLNYYGSYFYAPGYGYLWRPANTPFGWDPFFDGAWAWYPGTGYVWVSQYPWGWVPYRYGSWVFVPSYGWAWQPGGFGPTWWTVPVVRRAPPNFTPPRPPVVSTTGIVPVGGPRITPVPPRRTADDAEFPHRNPRMDVGAANRTSAAPAAPAAAPVKRPAGPTTVEHRGRMDRDDVERPSRMREPRTAPESRPAPRAVAPSPAPAPSVAPAPRAERPAPRAARTRHD